MLTLRSYLSIILLVVQGRQCLCRYKQPHFCAQANVVDVTRKDCKYFWSELCVCPQTNKDTHDFPARVVGIKDQLK